MKHEWMIALRALIVMMVLTGLLYPLAMTGFAQVAFSYEANGSLLRDKGRVIGSELLGQNFSRSDQFFSRPSATGDYPYHVLASAGSNLGPTNPALYNAIRERVALLRRADSASAAPIPVDLVTASASGLDPDISLAAALYQVPRVAKARGLNESLLRQLVLAKAKTNEYSIINIPRVNVWLLNAALDGLKRSAP